MSARKGTKINLKVISIWVYIYIYIHNIPAVDLRLCVRLNAVQDLRSVHILLAQSESSKVHQICKGWPRHMIPHPIVNAWNPAWYDRSLIGLDPVFAPCILGFQSSRLWSWKPKPITFHFSPRNPITLRNDGLIKLDIKILTYPPPTTLSPTRNTPGLKPPFVHLFWGKGVGWVGRIP